MKFSEQWLREWVDLSVSTDELVAQLSNAGLSVESVDPVAADLDGIVVGEVRAVEPHPGGDRLRVCEVTVGGTETFRVVCGAPNVRKGMKAPMAPVGTCLPNGGELERREIRGVESVGMLLSEMELRLGEDADGLMELPDDAEPGALLSEYLALDDVSIEIEITPNRGDCLSVAGVARELGVVNQRAVVGPVINPVDAVVSDEFPIALEAPTDCAHYVGRVVRNINPQAKTPVWMRERLRRSGLRAISPVVDVTNYVMLELGQPMHAFDFDRLSGGIRVRHASEGETLTLLDGNQLTLKPSTLVIADERAAVALGGVMGGLASAVTDSTRDIFLESAFFAPHPLGGEARGYGLHTDASYRFERGVDPTLQRRATERATALLIDVVGGEPGPIVEATCQNDLPKRFPVQLRPGRIDRVLGMSVLAETVSDVLTRLGMTVSEADEGWQVTPPAFRFDVTIEADLIEEIARITGYDNVPSRPPRASLTMIRGEESTLSLSKIRERLVARGYQEAITYSFVDSQVQSMMEPQEEAVRLANPISSNMDVMRSHLWPGLLQALLHNTKRQQTRLRLFETGLTFKQYKGDVVQNKVVSGIASGPAFPEQWGEPERKVDFFDVKSDVEALLHTRRRDGAFSFAPIAHPALHPGQAACVERNGRKVGLLGAVHPRIARALKLPGPAFVFELSLKDVQEGYVARFEGLSRFPSVRRDIAIIFDESVSAQAVKDCVGQAADDMLKKLEFFDVYRGEGIDSGKKSLAISLTFQATSRTLNDKEIDALVAEIVGALSDELSGELRGDMWH